jgi:O-acetyl-ADP-ribose deacetylase (regulator of RNase III)
MIDSMVIVLMTSLTDAEPALVQLRIEAGTQGQLDRQRLDLAVAAGELADLGLDDRLDVAAAGERLGHAGGVDVELDRRRAARQHVALEVRRDVEGEGVEPGIHARVHLGMVDAAWRGEVGRLEGAGDAFGQGRAVLVDDGDRRPVHGLRQGVGGG